MIRVCQRCQQPYKTPPSQRPRFCSHACASAAKVRHEIVPCAQCGSPTKVRPSRPSRFCSKSCARTFRNLTPDNPSFHRDISGAANPMFGRGRFGTDNPMFGKRGPLCRHWKGGRKTRPDGYVRVIAPEGHPRPCEKKANGSYILEHRLVMERHIGRHLLASEVVHHLDENPSNNAIDNLVLLGSQSEHARLHQEKRRGSLGHG